MLSYKKGNKGGIIVLFLVCSILWICVPRIPQDISYHHFADARELWGIPHFHNVISNMAFCGFALLGIRRTFGTPWFSFFLGLFFTGIGSTYYHLDPSNSSLFWDRFPMAIAFMGALSALMYERFHMKCQALCISFGALSVIYWSVSELLGVGDLRLYILTQFLSLWMMLGILVRFRRPYDIYLYGTLCIYVLSKVFEHRDIILFQLTGISGHTLKHYVASLTGLFVWIYLKKSVKPKDKTVII